ncbi:hypothetical protein GEMRC1_000391 [Eukaryota sp. GEM-RC1]
MHSSSPPRKQSRLCPSPVDASLVDPTRADYSSSDLPSTSNTPSLSASTCKPKAVPKRKATFTATSTATTSTTTTSTSKTPSLETLSLQILEYAQVKGSFTLKNLEQDLQVGYRRLYDVLNILLTTPLFHSTKENGTTVYTWCDGCTTNDPLTIATLSSDLFLSGVQLHESIIRCHKLEQVLRSDMKKINIDELCADFVRKSESGCPMPEHIDAVYRDIAKGLW